MAIIAGVTVHAQITDGSFELPVKPPNSHHYDVNDSAWTFDGTSGLIYPPSQFVAPSAVDGNQIAFLQFNPSQGTEQGVGVPGNISQSLFLDGTYQLDFWQASRSGGGEVSGNLAYQILIDDTVIFSRTSETGELFNPYSAVFTTAGPTVNLVIRVDPSVTSGDRTVYFDHFQLTPVPEPSAVALIGMGIAGLVMVRRRSR